MDLVNRVLNLVVPPTSLLLLAFSWPALTFIDACEWLYNTVYYEHMEGKVVIVTGASSQIGEQIAYEYAKRGANLVLIAKRDFRLDAISENATFLGAGHVIAIAADVVKPEDCKRFVEDTINVYGRVDHLVNNASLGHRFYYEDVNDMSVFSRLMEINFLGNVYPTIVALPYLQQTNGRVIINALVESWMPLPKMAIFASAKAALVNFYDTLRYELKEDVRITIATHGWMGCEMARGKFLIDEGIQWKEENETHEYGFAEEFGRLVVLGACRGEEYVKCPRWYNMFFLYQVLVPGVLRWTLRLLLNEQGSSEKVQSSVPSITPCLESPPSPKKTPTLSHSPRHMSWLRRQKFAHSKNENL